MSRNYRISIVLIFSLVAVAACCRSVANTSLPAPGSRIVTDGIGRNVTIPQNISRAVSLAPNLTETIFAVGAGDRLVGVTDYCNYPAEALAIKKIGDTIKPNVETIVELKPQIVFVTTASQLEAFTQTLNNQGITVFVTNPNSLESIYQSIEMIGDVMGEKIKAEAVVNNLKTRVAKVSDDPVSGQPKVFVQLDKTLYTIGKNSFLTDLIAKAGGISATADLPNAYPKLSKETAVALNPDVIILSDSADNNETNEAFKNSKATKNGKVFTINADILSRPSPRIVDALEEIAEDIRK